MKGGILRIVRVFRLFLGIEVIEVPVKLVEAVDGGQEFVAVAEVVLTNLSGGVSQRLEEFGDRRILLLHPYRCAGQTDGEQSRTKGMLSQNERSAPRRAALL